MLVGISWEGIVGKSLKKKGFEWDLGLKCKVQVFGHKCDERDIMCEIKC